MKKEKIPNGYDLMLLNSKGHSHQVKKSRYVFLFSPTLLRGPPHRYQANKINILRLVVQTEALVRTTIFYIVEVKKGSWVLWDLESVK